MSLYATLAITPKHSGNLARSQLLKGGAIQQVETV